MKSVLEAAPVMHQLAKNAAKHPIIAEYLAQDRNSPFTRLRVAPSLIRKIFLVLSDRVGLDKFVGTG